MTAHPGSMRPPGLAWNRGSAEEVLNISLSRNAKCHCKNPPISAAPVFRMFATKIESNRNDSRRKESGKSAFNPATRADANRPSGLATPTSTSRATAPTFDRIRRDRAIGVPRKAGCVSTPVLALRHRGRRRVRHPDDEVTRRAIPPLLIRPHAEERPPISGLPEIGIVNAHVGNSRLAWARLEAWPRDPSYPIHVLASPIPLRPHWQRGGRSSAETVTVVMRFLRTTTWQSVSLPPPPPTCSLAVVSEAVFLGTRLVV